MNILEEVFKTNKPIIGMVHLRPLPGSPLYDGDDEAIFEHALRDALNLQEGGIDAVMFCNEGDRPYTDRVGPETVAMMASVVKDVSREISVPYGIDVLFDPIAAISIAKATGAKFVREVFTGVYVGDVGFLASRGAEALRFRRKIMGDKIKTIQVVNAEFSTSMDKRPISLIAKGAVFVMLADIVAVSGPMTGMPVDLNQLKEVKEAIPETPVFANTGVNLGNLRKILEVADGAVVGTSLKFDGITWNPVDPERVKKFMRVVRSLREKKG
ncbi:MAG: BtpA/SgcQ family protein [Candidatus Asgardarchaeia archaeon]